MNKKQLYTALSRTTKFEYLHVENLKDAYHYKIYRVDFDDAKIYIGSTIKTLEK